MASITIRKLDDSVKAKLRIRAAQHGRSMEEEAREILTKGVKEKHVAEESLWDAIRRCVEPVGGIELELPKREIVRRPPLFDE